MSVGDVTFRGGVRTLVGFGVAFAVVTAIWVPLTVAVRDGPAWIRLLSTVAKFAVIAGVVWALLRVDEARSAELGLGRGQVAPALGAFALLWLALNAWGAAVAVTTGNEWRLSLIWHLPEPVAGQFGTLPAPWLVFVLLNFLVVGIVEEAAFRGYFQSKVIALLGDDTRGHVAFGVLATSVLFGALHTPGALAAGAGLGGVIGNAALPAITAVLFGVLYELTRNVYFVALLHGLGNTWPLVVDWAAWSGTPLLAFWVGAAAVYLAVTLGYRHYVFGTDQPHRGDRTEAGRSALLG